MWKQHAIADFSTSQLLLFCMLVWETVRFTNVELLLILRAYRAHPTRWIDVLNDVKVNISRTTPSAVLDKNISSAESRMSVKPRKLSLVTERSCKTQNHYQNDEMQLWQTCQTRKMRHQDRVEGEPYGRSKISSKPKPKTWLEKTTNVIIRSWLGLCLEINAPIWDWVGRLKIWIWLLFVLYKLILTAVKCSQSVWFHIWKSAL